MKQKRTLHHVIVLLIGASNFIFSNADGQHIVKLDVRRVIVNLDQGQKIGVKKEIDADDDLEMDGVGRFIW